MRLLYPFAVKIRLVDSPNERKLHAGEIPLIGGLAMFASFVITLLISVPDLNQVRGILIASTILIIVGVLDDHHDISVRLRLVLQIVAVLVMTSFSNVVVNDLGHLFGMGIFQLAGWAIPFTVVAAVGSMNAMNMIDGVDGLAGSTSLICFLAVLFLYSLAGDIALKPLLFAAVLIPFILNNLSSSRKVFMGDSGSMFLGFGIAWVLLEASQGKDAVMAPVTALWVFAIPLIDMWAIMLRRVMKGQSPFMADRDHLHHIFLRAGFSYRATLNIMSLIAVLFACVGIFGHVYQVPEWLMFAGFMVILTTYIWGIRHVWAVLKYVRHRSERRAA
ncbi:MAG: UDP-N-acetylglucosamine--undecaprenyl-phosphate N-acetylglucosaminephosphotransferase [Gammaproteobacteria bacterium]|nr:UDP-N-acetylglucosamine--undecaprenyl-phosphate N-acetylglucosaminephosphotransferase [Gammaproteobacteria bacterium]